MAIFLMDFFTVICDRAKGMEQEALGNSKIEKWL